MPKMLKKMPKIKIFFLILILFVILAAIAVFFLTKIANSPGPAQSNWIGREFKISDGDTWNSLGLRLKNENLIRSLLWYKIQLQIQLRLQKRPITLKAGSYIWPRFLNTQELIAFFQIAQPQKTYSVTIPEGFSRRQVALLLEKNAILSAEDFLKESSNIAKYAAKYNLPLPLEYSTQPEQFTLEGFLFPDTYFLPKTFSAEKMVELMLKNFIQNLEKIVPSWRDISSEQLYQKLVLASIVQKEYRATEEAPIIASVFLNRLKQRIKLESCATIVYVLTEELGLPHPNRILFKDLEHVSPYNTYLNQGLPPQPIASVGRIALNAVFHSAKTDYLFFVVKDAAKGTHTFSASLDDHNAAREAYLNNYFR